MGSLFVIKSPLKYQNASSSAILMSMFIKNITPMGELQVIRIDILFLRVHEYSIFTWS